MIAKKLFEARKENKTLPSSKVEFPSLSSFAIKKVAENYTLFPKLEGLTEKIRNEVISKVDTKIPVKITAPNIENESFWKKACNDKYGKNKVISLEKHGNSWKIAFLENYLSEFLSDWTEKEETKEIKERLIQEMLAVNKWIFSLTITRVQGYVNSVTLATYLPFLTSLSVYYGKLDTSFSMKKVLPGMRMEEAENLAEGIKSFNKLV